MKSQVYFAEEQLKQEYEKLNVSRIEDVNLHKWITRAIDDLSENAYCGIQVKKEMIPKIYIKKYKIGNLWKYDLPGGWRLLYSIGRENVIIISIIIEWMTHKEYERRFKY